VGVLSPKDISNKLKRIIPEAKKAVENEPLEDKKAKYQRKIIEPLEALANKIEESGKMPDEIIVKPDSITKIAIYTTGRILSDTKDLLYREPENENIARKTIRLKAGLLTNEITQDQNLERAEKKGAPESAILGGMLEVGLIAPRHR